MMGIPTCSKVQDHRWRDYRWLTMELDKFAKDNPVDISLRDLSQVLQKLGLDDKIALFSEYAQHNDSGNIDTSDVIQQLLWKSDTPKEIGYWREYHQTQRREAILKGDIQGGMEPGGIRDAQFFAEVAETDAETDACNILYIWEEIYYFGLSSVS